MKAINWIILKLSNFINSSNSIELKREIKELRNKVGVLTGRVISLQLTLSREQENVKHLYQHLGLKLDDEYDDIEEDEEGEWLKL